MFPKSINGENKHRKEKREREIQMCIDEMSIYIGNPINSKLKILEFGCGEGFQVPYLQQLGSVTACDIYKSEGISNIRNLEFVLTDIHKTSFKDSTFDLIFSNHVLEHIEDVQSAIKELKRIGNPSCIYAFAVPTNYWLMLSIPSQYYNRLRNLFKIWPFKKANIKTLKIKLQGRQGENNIEGGSFIRKALYLLLPQGHGILRTNFIKCYYFLKIKQWKRLFEGSSFLIKKTKPLLLYGPSEWPIIPTINSKGNICSSVFFILKKEK